MEMDFCFECPFFTHYKEKIVTLFGEKIIIEEGICCHDNSPVSPDQLCHIDWEQEAWINQQIDLED